MANFLISQELAEGAEGGYCLVPGDRGGETYEGISRVTNPDCAIWPIIDLIKSKRQIKYNEVLDYPGLEGMVDGYYKTDYWDAIHGDDIDSQLFATYFYDWYINSGRKAVEKLQEVLDIEPRTGFFGPVTLRRVNEAGDDLLAKIHARRVQYYQDHVKAVPEDKKFLKGWLERCAHLFENLNS